jgi:hypothetical protein
MLRVTAGGDVAYVWDVAQRTRAALKVAMDVNAASVSACTFDLSDVANINDIVDFDGDTIEDAIGLTTCSYCTSTYRLFLGGR